MAEVHQFSRNSVMEFSEYLHKYFFAPPCTSLLDNTVADSSASSSESVSERSLMSESQELM